MSLPVLPLGALVSPGLLALGAGLMAIPVIIHLLNKRKFKIIDWAAMDFLMEADRLNRRRIRLEDLLLLLMRCLAVFLLGLLVARPFFSDNPLSALLGGARYERYVLLDDSLSMSARSEGGSSLERAKENLERWLIELSAGNNDESLTLFLASEPDRPLYNAVPLNGDSVSEIVETIKELKPADRKVDLVAAVQALEANLASQEESVNRVIYFLSDARARDWGGGVDAGQDPLPAALARIAKLTGACKLVDFSSADYGNLVLESIKPMDKALIAGVPTRFEVTVRNTGRQDAQAVQVEFGAQGVIPMKADIDEIPGGSSASVPFTYTFAPAEEGDAASVPLVARVKAGSEGANDRLEGDNEHYYAARVLKGIPTLLVDGDPSTEFGRSETFFLSKALAPRGSLRSGISAQVIGESEFENTRLDAFQVVYICNMYRVSEERLESLDQWVREGGGLVFALGDQVDGETYRRSFFKEGKGLFPLELTGMLGDEQEQQWTGLQVRSARHPVLQLFEGEGSPLLEAVKIFRWWGSEIPESLSKKVTVLAAFTDEAQSPALVEMPYGKGRVVVSTTPMDIDWGTWPREAASFLITWQEMTRYLAPAVAGRYDLAAGEAIVQAIDLARYRSDLGITLPSGQSAGLQARNPGNESTTWLAEHEETGIRGFYALNLTRNEDGGVDELLYAANIDTEEGALEPMERDALLRLLEGSGVEVVEEVTLAGVSIQSSRQEWWPFVLMGLVCLLIGEQRFACHLGGKR